MISKTFTVMASITGVLAVFVLLVVGSVLAQSEFNDNKCPDYCDSKTDTLYLKGVWDEKLRQCVYAYEEQCKYGCEDDTRISIKPACKEFPDEPPANQTELDTTAWEMVKSLYDKDSMQVSVSVHGTEYSPFDVSKMFLQLLDSERQAINSSTCFATAYYPNTTSFFNDQLMYYVDDGLYYYDKILPNITGVYMLSAQCYIPELDINETFAWDDIECGNFNCGEGWSTDWLDYPSNALEVQSGGYTGSYKLFLGKSGTSNETANRSMVLPNDNTTTDSLTIRFYARTGGVAGDDYVYFWFCDGSNDCSNLYTWSSASPSGWNLHSFTLDSGSYDLDNGDTVMIKFNTTGLDGVGDGLDLDDFNITRIYDFNVSEYYEVKGAGEFHVSDSFNVSGINISLNVSGVGEAVWNYPFRNLTYINFSEVTDAMLLLNQSIYQAISNANSSIIGRVNQHNNTIMLKLYSMQDELEDIKDNTVQIISDVDDVYNVTEEVWVLLHNLTIGNVSVSAYVNWTEGAVEMNNISNPVIVESQLLTFAGRDQTPVQTVSRAYCVDNSTLAYDINTTRCWLDQCMTLNETFSEYCDYGCYQGSCNPEPFDRTLYIILLFLGVTVLIIGMALVYDRFVK